jgi:hypothetical protein
MAELRVKGTGTIKLFESDNTSSVTIASPASLGADRTITLPDGDVTLVAGTMSTGLTGWSTDSGTNDSLVPASASAGIYLGVAAATAANLLDDYEENTFTPTVGSLTLDAATGHYTKIGRAVSVQGYVSMGTQSGGTTMIVGGLPFTASSADQYLAVAGNYATDKAQTLRVIGGTSTTALVAQTEHSDNDNSDYNYNDMNGKYFYFHGVYFV